MQVTQGLRRALQVNADGIATLFGDRHRTWRDFAERVRRLAGALKGLGLARGDRVAILALNSDRYLEIYFAVPWAGGVIVPLNTRWAAPENIYAINDSESRFLIVDDAFAGMLETFGGKLSTIESIIFAGDGTCPTGAADYETLVGEAPAADDDCGEDDDLAGIFYTGGTTGQSKGVMLSHRNLVFNALNTIPAFGFDDDTIWLHAAPMFHLADGGSIVGVTMLGGRHVVIPRFDPLEAFRAIERHGVNNCLFVPTMINMLINHPEIGAYDLTSVRRVTYGASPMPEAVLKKAMAALKGWEFHQGYGMTELSPLATMLHWKFHAVDGPGARRLKSAGRAVPGVEVRIVDEAGKPAPVGEVGEIAVKGANVMLGYWNKPELTESAIRDGWMLTGDAAYMDEEGFIYLVDRLKDMIITGGENVYSTEVESAIYQHADIIECAVIGIPDETWGEAVHAVVVRRPGAEVSEADIIEHCHTLMAGYKCPRSVAFRDEPLPLSGAGKILKTALREPYWKGRKRRIN